MPRKAEWAQMLEQVEESLEQALSESARHEHALTSPLLAGDATGDRHVVWQQSLDRLGERLRGGQGRVELLGRQAAQAEAALAEVEAGLQRWGGLAETARRRLADGPGGGVS